MPAKSKTQKQLERTLKIWQPPEKLLLSEWADKYAYLSPESSADVGQWTCYPYQREIMDALIDPAIETLTWMKSCLLYTSPSPRD